MAVSEVGKSFLKFLLRKLGQAKRWRYNEVVAISRGGVPTCYCRDRHRVAHKDILGGPCLVVSVVQLQIIDPYLTKYLLRVT